MKKVYPLLLASVFSIGLITSCNNQNSDEPSNSELVDEDVSSNEVSSSSELKESEEISSEVISKNDKVGTFNRPYAPYYEVGTPLIEDGYVVYINFDGFAKYYFDEYLKLPTSKDSTLKSLMSEGVYFDNFETALPSVTNSCQNQILSGATTCVTKNVIRYYSKEADEVIDCGRNNAAKKIHQLTVENGLSTASVCHFLALEDLSQTDPSKLYVTNDPEDERVKNTNDENSYLDRFNQAIKLVKNQPLRTFGQFVTVKELPRFLMIYCDDLDGVGHNDKAHYGIPRALTEKGRMENVLKRLELMDDKLGEFIQACKDQKIYDKMTFFLTTDHGMTPFGVQSENDSKNYGKSKFGQLCDDIRKFNKSYNVELLQVGEKPKANTSVVATGMNLDVTLKFKNGITEDQLQMLKTYLLTKDYVYDVFTKEELREQGYWVDVADMIIVPAEHYCFSRQLLANYVARAQHDTSQPTSKIIFGLAWGKGIRKNEVFTERAFNYDFGVTMAACFGLELPEANGIVLDIFEH